MPSQKLLLMLVMDVLENQETTDIVNHGVLLHWVEVHSVLVTAIVANRVL